MGPALRTVAATVMVTLLAAAGWAASPAGDSEGTYAFLYIPGVRGDAADPAHRNWIEVLSCDWGAVPPPRGSMVPSSGKGAAGKLWFGDFTFLKNVDASSKVLADYCDRGVRFSHLKLELAETTMGQFRYLVLRKVRILSVRPGDVSGDGSGTEIVTVEFRQVEYR